MENQTLPLEWQNSGSLNPVPIRIRCPECLKLYSIAPEEIKSVRPKFLCPQCQTKFWMAYPEATQAIEKRQEIIGLHMDGWEEKMEIDSSSSSFSNALSQKSDPCPRCQKLLSRGAEECPHCGVLVQRFLVLQKLKKEDEEGFPTSKQLRSLWSHLLEKYDDMDLHQKFLRACQTERNLVFASRQYSKVLKAYAGDEIALKMRNQILTLTQMTASTLVQESKITLNRTSWNLSMLVIFVSAVVVAVGLLFDPWRNMVGVGVAIIFFTLAFIKR